MNHTIPHVFRTTQLPGTCPRECVCACVCVCVGGGGGEGGNISLSWTMDLD